jgi:nitrogen regulatory protein PII
VDYLEVFMHFKLILAFVDDEVTDKVMDAAREAGATGATVISNARGEGIEKTKTFLGLTLETQRDVLLFLVEEHLSRRILEKINATGELEDKPGSGIAIQIDVEDAIGVTHQVRELSHVVEEEL